MVRAEFRRDGPGVTGESRSGDPRGTTVRNQPLRRAGQFELRTVTQLPEDFDHTIAEGPGSTLKLGLEGALRFEADRRPHGPRNRSTADAIGGIGFDQRTAFTHTQETAICAAYGRTLRRSVGHIPPWTERRCCRPRLAPRGRIALLRERRLGVSLAGSEA